MKLYSAVYLVVLTIVLIATATATKAQKLPTVQNGSVNAPVDVVIDGKATEWNLPYQAYNKATEVFYTIANDKDNLYLVIHADKARIIEKILESGIEFKVNETAKKDAKNIFSLVFPLLPLSVAKSTLAAAGKQVSGVSFSAADMANGTNILTDKLKAEAEKNSQLMVFDKPNKQLHDNLTTIKILGATAIVDTVPGVDDITPYYKELPLRRHRFKIIPLANKDDIKAMLQFDDKGELTYELADPLKYLNASQSKNELYYNIVIHGRGEDGRIGNTVPVSRLPGGRPVGDNQDLEYPTDFSGEYTLYSK